MLEIDCLKDACLRDSAYRRAHSAMQVFSSGADAHIVNCQERC